LSETQAAIDDTTSLECLVLNFMNWEGSAEPHVSFGQFGSEPNLTGFSAMPVSVVNVSPSHVIRTCPCCPGPFPRHLLGSLQNATSVRYLSSSSSLVPSRRAHSHCWQLHRKSNKNFSQIQLIYDPGLQNTVHMYQACRIMFILLKY
jgi:hypothetical protein